MSRTFYVLKDTVTVPVVSAATTILYIFLARFLADTWGYVGLAAAQPLYSGLAIVILAVILVMRLRSLHTGKLLRDLLMYSAASGVAFAAAWFVSSALAATPALVQLIGAGAVAGLLYVALVFLIDRNIALSILDMMGVQTLLGRLGWPRMTKPHVADSVPKANR
jgi:peptidoglycan biosynthesis protein MviN/MurJ (putative lipid II flippase)